MKARVEELRAGHRRLRWQLRRTQERTATERAAHDAHAARTEDTRHATIVVLERQLEQAWDDIAVERRDADEERSFLLSELVHS
eukprot:COSAG01_NODE_54986_length_328_cov_0.903930_1_plen_83_part_01